ncbi:cyclin-dependent kinase inhibitor 1-like [Cherax quadricarinatus]|uniref:cyclin-dependent kinase inhibitor 1-like n=1 Tax=Cherax quadricarinatus TaxID=27406 RepID=UPI002378A27B|nr:uncharacterized protein LOC128703951 [Cherax quadricarinatus]
MDTMLVPQRELLGSSTDAQDRIGHIRRKLFGPSSTNTQDRIGHTRRSLFGPIDHEHSLMFVQEEMVKIRQRDSSRWNFDFQEMTPLEGRYSWKPLDENVPQAYQIPSLTPKTTASPHSTTSISTSSSTTSHSSSSRRSKCLKRLVTNHQVKKTQKLCTDFFKHVKTSKNVTNKQRKTEVLASAKPLNVKLSDILKIRSLNVR